LIQTAGEFLNWHPHLHVLTATGAFREDGSFAPSPYFDATTLRELFQTEVLRLLLKEGMISPEFSLDPFPDYGPQRKGREMRKKKIPYLISGFRRNPLSTTATPAKAAAM